MLGEGGRVYWGREEEEEEEEGPRGPAQGIVVVFAWLSSDERHLRPFVDLYASLGWRSLLCHADFLTLFFPEKATLLACSVLDALVKEVKGRPLPIIFAAFSGGPKGCMYKVLQLIEGKCEGQHSMVEYQRVRDCLCGQIYDSSPVDFTSDLGTRFVCHPSVLKMPNPPRVIPWMAKTIAYGLNTLFLRRFEAQRAEYWQTLYSSVNVGPCLIFCSEDDELAPFPVVCNFAQRMQELGGDVTVVKWINSPHVGHYKHHPAEYKAAVLELLDKAAAIYSQRRQQVNGETAGMDGSCNKHPDSGYNDEAAVRSNGSLRRLAIEPSDHLLSTDSMEYGDTKDGEQKGDSFQVQSPPTINAHGVLGQILFDVCVPKNVEGWDIKPVISMNGKHTFASARRLGPFNPIRFIRRSKL